ncbi:hypothetical protein F4775DRAFT_546585 [Biscogniauxia sp. FL1348]|nr:hypothetical protein F4775DRAFT_546585 [Biscogniauxia sp. FL1348]
MKGTMRIYVYIFSFPLKIQFRFFVSIRYFLEITGKCGFFFFFLCVMFPASPPVIRKRSRRLAQSVSQSVSQPAR